jgi:hypothetical protein
MTPGVLSGRCSPVGHRCHHSRSRQLTQRWPVATSMCMVRIVCTGLDSKVGTIMVSTAAGGQNLWRYHKCAGQTGAASSLRAELCGTARFRRQHRHLHRSLPRAGGPAASQCRRLWRTGEAIFDLAAVTPCVKCARITAATVCARTHRGSSDRWQHDTAGAGCLYKWPR